MDIKDPFITTKITPVLSQDCIDRDEETLFKKNKNKLKKYQNGLYVKKRLTYSINKFGYRCDHVFPPNKDYILVMGCSHTFGHSLHKENRYGDLLEKYTNIPVLNVGYPGGSRNLIRDNLLHLLSSGYKLPKIVVLQWPELMRAYIGYNGINHSTISKNVSLESLEKYSKDAQRHTYWILNNFNIKYVEFEWFNSECDNPNFYLDKARDLNHPGVKSNLAVFNWLKGKIDEL